MIPFVYSCRNLARRPLQSIQLTAGSCFVVLLVMLAAAMNQAMERTLADTGSPENVILLGAGSEESVERSEVSSGTAEIASSSIRGMKEVMGKAAVSPEVHFNGLLELSSGKQAQALVRGVSYQALWVHRKIRLKEGRFPRSGEGMVGKLAHVKLGVSVDELSIGSEIFFNGERIVISGIYEAPGTVLEAEVWMPLADLMAYTQRENLSCVVLALEDAADYALVDAFSKKRLDLELVAVRETEYYGKLSGFYAPIRWMAWVCSALLSTGALFGGLNTLHAAFSTRIREFGALQAIGFSRLSLLTSLVQEASVTGIIGSALAFVLVLSFFQGIAYPFAIGVFLLDFDSPILVLGLTSGLVLGLLGGLPPGWYCLRPSLPETLRSS